jgi:hypothetical protein
VRVWLVTKMLAGFGHICRLIGIDIMFAVFYSSNVQKLEEELNVHINRNQD